MTLGMRTYMRCSFSKFVSYRDALSLGNTTRLTLCHLGSVSDSCHFLTRPVSTWPRCRDPQPVQTKVALAFSSRDAVCHMAIGRAGTNLQDTRVRADRT
jgi:hypothetical protein